MNKPDKAATLLLSSCADNFDRSIYGTAEVGQSAVDTTH